MLNFKLVSLITSAITFILCIVLFISPNLIFILFGIEPHSSTYFVGRRTAILLLGIALLTFWGRNAPHSEARQAICLSLAISMLALALLGSAEFLRGFAGTGIWLAITTEMLLAFLYVRIWRYGRQ
ncbi:hypothetical protein KJY73_06810 [Bowmanella sp. Y26]|uniref:hypothetical protein n=1 Tax=Bowmanella yangjiangensis TaxID=2811230 RepID=UPI001BDC951B|nr:hypothetical protein [Bowmanella yangjiangensis]MBT1063277.1 hypothetical protein [Bowmanella yangjiangensis]